MKEPLASLFSPTSLGAIELSNRIVMAPMTRSRASAGDLVTDLHVEYYRQRASAGLIVTEGVQPSIDGKGYCRTPGIYDQQQVKAWREVTEAVHERGASIVCQIMHCGRVGHSDNKDSAARHVAPSAIRCEEQIFTEKGMQDMDMPEALSIDDIASVIADYRNAARNAIDAGFDGIELHCTSGYLPAQFLSTGTNQRDDQYGGTLENRLRFILQVIEQVIAEIGADRVGIRICPGNPFNGLHDDNPRETFKALLQAIDSLGLAYVHVIRMPSTGIDNVALVRDHFTGGVIVNDSYSTEEAAQVIAAQSASAVSFGRFFVSNPDLVDRIRHDAPLAKMNPKTLYTPGAAGYIDYPAMQSD